MEIKVGQVYLLTYDTDIKKRVRVTEIVSSTEMIAVPLDGDQSPISVERGKLSEI